MSSDDARKIGKDVGLLLICKIHESQDPKPLVAEVKKRFEPTIDDPVDEYKVYMDMHVDLYEAWIYDKKNGRILIKQILEGL
jgi:hypothetical protein